MRLPGGMKFDVDTYCEKVIKTPIVYMEYSAPIEDTRHSHGLAPSLYGFVLEESDEGTFRRIGTWNASSSGTASTSSVHELLPYFAHKIISLV
jgi:hypothetical protein